MDEKTKAEREARRRAYLAGVPTGKAVQNETVGGYLAAIAKRKGISIDEARAEMIRTNQTRIINIAAKIANPDDGEK